MYEKIIVGACEECKHGNKEIFQRPCAKCFDTFVMGGKEGICFEQKEEETLYFDRFTQWCTRCRYSFRKWCCKRRGLNR